MKKFYENPVVEITKFDVEDAITASVLVDTLNPEEGIDAVVAGLEADIATLDKHITVVNFSTYSW